jgi:DNA-binding NtrC family response regulator
MHTLLIVDDEGGVRESLQAVLKGQYRLLFATNGREALSLLQKEPCALALLDLMLPGMDGLTLLKRIKESWPYLPVIMLTAATTVRTAVEAMKMGAADYLAKPFDVEELRLTLSRWIHHHDLQAEVRQLRTEVDQRYGFSRLIGKSRAMREVYAKIEQLMDTRATVLITGESGVGKELAARAIHYNSGRRQKPFVAIHCGSLPDVLIESELFGHERGAFTDAVAQKIGTFEQADGGTLLLDEITDLGIGTQAKLLRVLQEREITRIGATHPIRVDVRLIVSSNRNLEEAMQNGLFREDLYYRINVVEINIPPLRVRREDIPLLLSHFLSVMTQEKRQLLKEISKEALDLLVRYHWPGNVRELENLVEQMVTLVQRRVILPEDIPLRIRDQVQSESLKERVLSGKLSLTDAVEQFERTMIQEALRRAHDVQVKAARLLGVTRRILRYKMELLGLIRSPAKRTGTDEKK